MGTLYEVKFEELNENKKIIDDEINRLTDMQYELDDLEHYINEVTPYEMPINEYNKTIDKFNDMVEKYNIELKALQKLVNENLEVVK